MTTDHAKPLFAIAQKPGVWAWMPNEMTSVQHMVRYVDEALCDQAAGTAIPFTVTQKDSGKVIGSTRYGNVNLDQRRVEIGWTFFDPGVWRTVVNTECKRLLLAHAFEKLLCQRVELKTDGLNTRSRNAILRLGAKEEGILRSHMVCDDGRVRDTVYFSILKGEWPAVRRFLDARLSR